MDILELQLLTNDLEGTKSFYSELLGFPLADQSEDTISFNAGQSKLVFLRSEESNPFYHFAFNIPDNKIAEAFEWTSRHFDIPEVEKGKKIADFLSWNARAFYFHDNNGNILEFIARFDLHQSSDKPFDGSSVLSISEIGIPMKQAAEASERIRVQHQLRHFEKQAPKEDFIVVGDNCGLLIFVEEHRPWFPTARPAEQHWLRVIVGSKGNNITLSVS